jgi:hypothetical protein
MCSKKVSYFKLILKCQLTYFIVLLAIFPFIVNAQIPEILNTFTTVQRMLPGVKNVMGGLLAVDDVHKKCIQKTICNQFVPEIIETRAEFDPVKRSLVLVPKVIQERGKLRWIGDMIVNMFTG